MPEDPAASPVDLHVACPDAATAEEIARAAVEARLAACVNITERVVSVFRWQGAIETDTEALASFKTTAARAGELAALIRTRHPYDLPAITWHAAGADEATARWLAAETGG